MTYSVKFKMKIIANDAVENSFIQKLMKKIIENMIDMIKMRS